MTDLKDLTLGKRIQVLRREQALTQEALAERMGVTSQAVSKWENDLSCPDILSLPQLAKELHATVDALLTGQTGDPSSAAAEKKPEELIVRMAIHTDDGTRLCLNLPFTVFRLCAMYGMLSVTFRAEEGELDAEALARAMADVDFRSLAEEIMQGRRGTLVSIDDSLTIWTE